jgi:hypothetical protein
MNQDEAFSTEVPDAVDEAALRRMRAVARVLDDAVRVPGTNVRVGLDPLLSALPSPVSDAVGAGLSLYIVLEAANLGVPYTTIVRMLANVALDFAVGSVPVVGWLFDAVWKANRRNVALVERHLEGARGGDEPGGGDGDESGDDGPIEIEVAADD